MDQLTNQFIQQPMPQYGYQQLRPNQQNYPPSASYVSNQIPPAFQQPRPSAIPGRIVGCLEEITANDVPMDGSVSLFPTSDYSCIYAKAWRADGTINTVKFVADLSAQNSNMTDPIKDAIDRLDTRLDRIEKRLNGRRSYPKKSVTKESSDNV